MPVIGRGKPEEEEEGRLSWHARTLREASRWVIAEFVFTFREAAQEGRDDMGGVVVHA